jgi:hypothetical protein
VIIYRIERATIAKRFQFYFLAVWWGVIKGWVRNETERGRNQASRSKFCLKEKENSA